MKLDVTARSLCGNSYCKKLRNEGKLPAVLYGKNINSISLMFEARNLTREMLGTVIDLCYGGNVSKAMIKDIQHDPVSGLPIHVDFIAANDKDPIVMDIKCRFVNVESCVGVKYGGVLNSVLKKVRLLGLPKNLPQFVDIDVSKLNIGDKVRASDLVLPKDVKLHGISSDTVVANILGKKSAAASATESEAADSAKPEAKKK